MPDRIVWARGKEDDFISMIDHELKEAQSARLSLDRQHRDWLSQYRVSAKPALKRFPYEGAANWTLPLTAIDVDVLYARFMQTIHAPENLWTITPLNERWIEAAKPLQDFLEVLDKRLLRMFNVNKRVFLECVKLGTGIYKTGWTYERREVWGYDNNGQRQRQTRIVSAPFVDHVRLSDWLMPAYSYAIQPDEQGGAPWCAERLRVPLGRLFSLAQATEPFLPNIDRDTMDFISRFEEAEKPPHDVKLQELDFVKRASTASASALNDDEFDRDSERGTPAGSSLQRPREIELWEINARFATGVRGARNALTAGSDNSEDDVKVWYHQPTRKIVRGVFQYYHSGQREYDAIRYFPGDGFWGIGICEQKEMFQALGSELMNFTLDNVLLANSRMIVAQAGANIGPGEPIYPYKVWLTEGDVRQQFGVFPMADIYPSLPMVQRSIAELGEKRTGIGDLQLAQLNELPGRTPAATMQSLLAEGSRRPDLTIRDMRHEGLSVVGLRVLQLCQQFISSPIDFEGKRWLHMLTDVLGLPEGPAVAQKLMTPVEPVELGIGVQLTATSGSANKEVERQSGLALLQLAGQVGPQFIQLVQIAMQAQGTPLAQVAMRQAMSLQELYKRVLEQYDIRDIENILPLDNQLASQTSGDGGAPPAGDFGGGNFGAQGPSIDPRLASLFAGFGAGGGATSG